MIVGSWVWTWYEGSWGMRCPPRPLQLLLGGGLMPPRPPKKSFCELPRGRRAFFHSFLANARQPGWPPPPTPPGSCSRLPPRPDLAGETWIAWAMQFCCYLQCVVHARYVFVVIYKVFCMVVIFVLSCTMCLCMVVLCLLLFTIRFCYSRARLWAYAQWLCMVMGVVVAVYNAFCHEPTASLVFTISVAPCALAQLNNSEAWNITDIWEPFLEDDLNKINDSNDRNYNCWRRP